MGEETIKELLKSKHKIIEVTLTVCRQKICDFEETNYTFTGKRGNQSVEGTILYSIEHTHYCVTEKPNKSGYWL